MGFPKKMLTIFARNFLTPKIAKNGRKMPKKRGPKFFLEILFLRIVPQVLGQVWAQKSKKKFEKKYRLGAIEEKLFFREKS